MNTNVNAVVMQVDEQIAWLTELRGRLVEFGGQAPEIVQTSEPELVTRLTTGVPAARAAKVREQKRGGRKGKVEGRMQNAEAAAPTPAAVPRTAAGGERAKTLSGAMKLIIAAMGTFTREALRGALQEEYGGEEFFKNASASSFPANLSYWVTHGKLSEDDQGAYKVIDKAFFGSVEFKS